MSSSHQVSFLEPIPIETETWLYQSNFGMKSLEHVPVELKMRIIEELGQSGLGSVSRLNKHWRDIATGMKQTVAVSEIPSEDELKRWRNTTFAVFKKVSYNRPGDHKDILALMDDILKRKHGPRVEIMLDLSFREMNYRINIHHDNPDVYEIMQKALSIKEHIHSLSLAHDDMDYYRPAVHALAEHVSIIKPKQVSSVDFGILANATQVTLDGLLVYDYSILRLLKNCQQLVLKNLGTTIDFSVCADLRIKELYLGVHVSATFNIFHSKGFQSLKHLEQLAIIVRGEEEEIEKRLIVLHKNSTDTSMYHIPNLRRFFYRGVSQRSLRLMNTMYNGLEIIKEDNDFEDGTLFY